MNGAYRPLLGCSVVSLKKIPGRRSQMFRSLHGGYFPEHWGCQTPAQGYPSRGVPERGDRNLRRKRGRGISPRLGRVGAIQGGFGDLCQVTGRPLDWAVDALQDGFAEVGVKPAQCRDTRRCLGCRSFSQASRARVWFFTGFEDADCQEVPGRGVLELFVFWAGLSW